MTTMSVPRCRSMLTRNRPTPGALHEQSKSEIESSRSRSQRRQQLRTDLRHLFRREALLRERDELSADPGADEVAGLDVDVRRAALNGGLEDLDHDPSRSGGWEPRDA
jgi:hypothetical protein